MTSRWNYLAAGLIGLAATGLLFVGDAFAQRRPIPEPAEPARVLRAAREADEGKKLEVVWYGNSACNNKGCHGGDPPKNWFKNADTGKQFELISRCVEADIFDKHDKHGEAYKVLTGELGKQMSRILKYDVTKAPQCLSCHGVHIDPKDEKTLKASQAVGFDVNEGVSCAVCHGPHREWVANHGIMVSAGKFRGLSRQKKEDEYGMYNLHDPIKRTELCVSCHVGNRAQNKFVTHEMYAAGHPPLPGFEVATFSNAEPRHWQYMKEKSPALQKELGLRAGEQEETLLMLIGGVISFRETMVLLREQAMDANRTTDEAKKILDLSNFDCWTCHHDLKKQAWRQNREWIGNRKPGRPPMRDWSVELARLAIHHLKEKDRSIDGVALLKAFDDGVAELNAAFDVQTGGDPARIEKAASNLVKLSQTLANGLYQFYPTADDAKALLKAVPTTFGKKLVGYDSARQIAWGAQILQKEAYATGGTPTAVLDSLKALDEKLKLQLPTGRKNTIADVLNSNMEAVDRYDPFEFRKLLQGAK